MIKKILLCITLPIIYSFMWCLCTYAGMKITKVSGEFRDLKKSGIYCFILAIPYVIVSVFEIDPIHQFERIYLYLASLILFFVTHQNTNSNSPVSTFLMCLVGQLVAVIGLVMLLGLLINF